MAQAAFSSPVGRLIVHSSGQGVTRIAWSEDELTQDPDIHCHQTVAWLDAFFRGEEAPVPTLDDGALTRFQATVCRTLMETGWGEVTTYGRLARAVGNPQASRAVGSVMAMNPWPLLVPCHRVVQAGGGLGNYSGAGGPTTKARLLGFEGHAEHGDLRDQHVPMAPP